MKAKDFISGQMLEMKSVTVLTTWGEENSNAMYCEDTGFCYMKFEGGWMNYEPQQVERHIFNED